MIKKIFLFCCVFVLMGCASTYSETNIENYLLDFETSTSFRDINNSSHYYRYYLPSDMQKGESDELDALLKYNNVEILMSVNIVPIVNDNEDNNYFEVESAYYNEDKLVYSRNGKYINREENELNYLFSLYNLGERYFLLLQSDEFQLTAFCNEEEVDSSLRHILVLAKNALCDEENVMADYSFDIIIDYEKKTTDLFTSIMPKNGYLSDMLLQEQQEEEE